ncbi:translation factor SUA5 [Dongia mobilis]|uniref:Threonylcarbamoyl-AMP synthase n=1 Tax=Dongia mobilis TaxID=578943 RepID=A0A4R6WT06_9PROT|nr:L-threonylcarbamoyladenylate synthase [Dongia mobilis]TDQ83148.1 translation factor SUA5 [Dongia mobilis]
MTQLRGIVPADAAHIAAAAEALKAGDLVAFPTETVYGLGGDACSDRAVARIYEAKGRPSFNPLIVHVTGLAAAGDLAELPPAAFVLAELFWPGPLTLVLPRRRNCRLSLLVSAGMDSVALRVPAHPVARALLAASNLPLAGPSANPSGRISPTTAQHVADGLGDKVAMILDGGPCRIGLESTVVSLLEDVPQLLRPGGIEVASLEAALGCGVALAPQVGDVAAGLHGPGRLLSHYAPDRPVRVGAVDMRPGEALLAFGPTALTAQHMANLSPAGDLTEAAANLFAMLRTLDRPGITGIAVMPIPERGLGVAINDRLRRAAAPR